MRVRAFLATLAAVFASGCGLSANTFFRGSPPESQAPRVVVAVETLESLRHAPKSPPYWQPSPHQVHSCEVALWRRAHWSRLQRQVTESGAQFIGATRNGRQVIVVNTVCARLSHRHDLGQSIVLGLHTGSCTLHAVCHPGEGRISSFHTGTRAR